MNFTHLFLEARYGHTLWITDKGKIIDISRTDKIHHSWANQNRDKFKIKDPDLDIFSITARSGWIKVANHGDAQTFLGMSNALKKHKDLLLDIMDSKILVSSRYRISIETVDKNGDTIGRRQTFMTPDDDAKLRRFI